MAVNYNDQQTNNTANNLTNNGTTEWLTDFPFAASTEAIQLSGTAQYASAADSASLSVTGDLTLESWVKLDNLAGPQSPVSKFVGGGISYLMYILPTTGAVRFYSSSDGTTSNAGSGDSVTTISTGTWTHVAIVYTASTQKARFFFNGTFDVERTGYATSLFDSTTPVGVGCYDPLGTPQAILTGKLDEVRIWNVARTDLQISNNYNTEIPTNSTGLVAYWPFEAIATTTSTSSTSSSSTSTSSTSSSTSSTSSSSTSHTTSSSSTSHTTSSSSTSSTSSSSSTSSTSSSTSSTSSSSSTSSTSSSSSTSSTSSSTSSTSSSSSTSSTSSSTSSTSSSSSSSTYMYVPVINLLEESNGINIRHDVN